MKNISCFIILFVSFFILNAQSVSLSLVSFATGFDSPVEVTHAGDDRIFVVEKQGLIKIVDQEGNVNAVPFLDIDAQVNSIADERGLLGLAFHPEYKNNGYFYVNYSKSDGDTRVSRFTVSADSNVADPASEKIILEIDQPFSNHNGGCIRFGPEGYLYIGMGDGGAGGDPSNYAQNRTELLGKMLRIDIDNGDPYSIPETNPFVNDDFTLDEIWAIGVRNPWRFSFDRIMGDLWIGDVGQDNWEEIDFQPASSLGGENYGWRCYEGDHPFNTSGCEPQSSFMAPVYEYLNSGSTGCSVTGGFVYRGGRFQNLFGKYVFVDFCSGIIRTTFPDTMGGWMTEDVLNEADYEFSSIGEDKYGELYFTALGEGVVYHLQEAACEPVASFSTGDSIHLCGGDTLLQAIEGFGHIYQWSLNGIEIPGATNSYVNVVDPGVYTVVVSNDQACSSISNPVYVDACLSQYLSKSNASLSVFPNPSNGSFSLHFDPLDPSSYQLNVLNLYGKAVYKSVLENSTSSGYTDLNLKHLPRGIYLLQVSSGKTQYSQKILIQ